MNTKTNLETYTGRKLGKEGALLFSSPGPPPLLLQPEAGRDAPMARGSRVADDVRAKVGTLPFPSHYAHWQREEVRPEKERGCRGGCGQAPHRPLVVGRRSRMDPWSRQLYLTSPLPACWLVFTLHADGVAATPTASRYRAARRSASARLHAMARPPADGE